MASAMKNKRGQGNSEGPAIIAVFEGRAQASTCSPDECGPYCNPNCNPFEGCSPHCLPPVRSADAYIDAQE